MTGLLWAAVSLAAALVWHRRLEALVLAALTIWTLMPGLARAGWAIGPIDLHPAAVFVGCVFLVQLLRHPDRLALPLRQAPVIILMFSMVGVLTTIQTVLLSRGPEGVMFGVEQIVLSLLAFLLVGSALLERPGFSSRLAGWLVGLVALQGVLATIQAQLHLAVVWQMSYFRQYWYQQNFDRWMGTTDHPLVLSLLIVMVMPLLARPMPSWLRLLALALLASGMLATQSRTGFGIMALELVWLVLRARGPVGSRAFLGLGMLATAVVAWTMGAFDGILLRLTSDDGGSADVRTRSIEYLLDHVGEFSWLGRGMNQNMQLAGQAGFGTSFESSFIMHMIDMGLPLALVYYGTMLACIVMGLVRRAQPGAAVGALAAVVTIQTFSALGARTASAALLWVVLALCAFTQERRCAVSDAR